jgi:hypothetical protein
MFDLDTPRRVSILIVLVYAAIYFFAAPPVSAAIVVVRLFQLVGYFLLPLACIWYGDEMGEYVGILPGPAINRTTPGWIVKAGGWFLLFLPALLVLFVCLIDKP